MTHRASPVFDLNAFSLDLDAESDRACAVLGAALLDARLEELYKRRLRQGSDDILASSGPLGSFSSRIKLGRALSWLSDDVVADLEIIRRIRNDFAHSADHRLAFSDRGVSDRCLALRSAAAYLQGFEALIADPGPNFSAQVFLGMQKALMPARKRYQMSVEFIAQYLDAVPVAMTEGPTTDLCAELRRLGARADFVISGKGTVRDSGRVEGE